MSETNIPIDLRALVIYDFFDWKTSGSSYKNYKNLSTIIGADSISEKEFELKFDEIVKEYHTTVGDRDEKTVPKIDIRFIVLSEVLRKRSLLEIDEDLKEAFGIENFKFDDLYFWFCRFHEGVSTVDFSDIPLDVLEKIIEKLNFKSQLRLRKVSCLLRDLTNRSPPNLKKLRISLELQYVSIEFDEDRIIYAADDDYGNPYKKGKLVKADDYLKVAFEDYKFALSHPKLQLDTLFIRLNEKYEHFMAVIPYQRRRLLNEFFKSLKNRKISVRKFTMDWRSEEDAMAILPYFEPGILETIFLSTENSVMDHIVMDRIVETEQWKRAKDCHVQGFPSVAIKHFLHLDRFHVTTDLPIDINQMLQLREILSNSPNFKRGVIDLFDDQLKWEYTQIDEETPFSNQFLDYRFDHGFISISKKNI